VSEESPTDIGGFEKHIVSTKIREYVSGYIGDQVERELWGEGEMKAMDSSSRVWGIVLLQVRDDTREKTSV
jgi:hypothetical protein